VTFSKKFHDDLTEIILVEAEKHKLIGLTKHCKTCTCNEGACKDEIVWPPIHPLTTALRSMINRFFSVEFLEKTTFDQLTTKEGCQITAMSGN